jgi:fimbrial chaperone protein
MREFDMNTKNTSSVYCLRDIVLCSFALIVMAVTLVPVPAHADLTILPIRVLMEDRDRNAELTLVNTSDTTNTYRLEWRHRRMKEVGGYEHLDAPLDPLFNPDETIKFSPRHVTIAPGQTQRIRLSLRKPADLPDGEYRAHLVLKKVAGAVPRGNKPQSGLSVQVQTNVGFSIPVVVRQGPYDAAVKISNPQFSQPARPGDVPHMTLNLSRTGIHSINGTVRVYWTPEGADERLVGQAKNVNVFHEIDKRLVGVSMREDGITSGVLRITFEGANEKKCTIYDEQIFPIGR